MTKKIFRSIVAVAAVVLLASLFIITSFFYDYFGNVQKKQMEDELRLAAAGVEQSGAEYLEHISSEHFRLTLIAPDGNVIYDTETDAASLENHAAREEVKEAL